MLELKSAVHSKIKNPTQMYTAKKDVKLLAFTTSLYRESSQTKNQKPKAEATNPNIARTNERHQNIFSFDRSFVLNESKNIDPI